MHVLSAILCFVRYTAKPLIKTPLGPLLIILFMEVSLFQRFYMYTCQCEGYRIGQSNGVLLKEVAAFQRCPLTKVHCKQ